jgi:hypothetical protein
VRQCVEASAAKHKCGEASVVRQCGEATRAMKPVPLRPVRKVVQ